MTEEQYNEHYRKWDIRVKHAFQAFKHAALTYMRAHKLQPCGDVFNDIIMYMPAHEYLWVLRENYYDQLADLRADFETAVTEQ